jgi:hypothetical protein
MADEVTLLPCVRCKSPGKMNLAYSSIQGVGYEDHWVSCTNRECPVKTGIHESDEEAAEVWNTMGANATIAKLEAVLAVKDARIKELEAQLNLVEHQEGNLCETCGQPLEPTWAAEKAHMMDHVAELEALRKPFPELETCDLCGRAMGIGFHVDDEVWRQLNPSGDEWGVLCPWCANERAKELGLTDVPTTFFFGFDVLRESPMPHEAACQERIAGLGAQLAEAQERTKELEAENAIVYERLRTTEAALWGRADRVAELTTELAALKGRTCVTCCHHDERGWCEVNTRTFPATGSCSEWEPRKDKEAPHA